MKPSLLILAAGIGSRYGGLKQLDAIGPNGETIIEYSIYDAIITGFGKIVFVIKESIEKEFTELIIDKVKSYIDVDFVNQEIWKVPDGISFNSDRTKPWGTGHAILMAADKIDAPFAVINADDFYGRGAYKVLADYYNGWTPVRENDYSMVAYEIGKTLSDHGFVSRGICQTDSSSFLENVVERTRIERIPAGIAFQDEAGSEVILSEQTVVSMNFWGFTPSFFSYLRIGFTNFIKANAEDLKAEYYIPTAVNGIIQKREATVRVLSCNEKWYGMTYRDDREVVVAGIRNLIEKGVYPEKLWG